MTAPVDALDVLAVLVFHASAQRNPMLSYGRYSGDNDLEEASAAVAELIDQMRDVLALWDSDGMSIDGKAATMQCRPEKWRAVIARFGGAA